MIKCNNQNRENILADLIPDLTPLIDVMFMLMVFLILTINQAEKIFNIETPKDEENISILNKNSSTIKITIFASNNEWAISDKKFNDFYILKNHLENLTDKNHNSKIIIYSDKKANVEKLLKLMTYLKKEKINNINIIME